MTIAEANRRAAEEEATMEEIFGLMHKLSHERFINLGLSIIAGPISLLPPEKRPGALLEVCNDINLRIKCADATNAEGERHGRQ